MDRWKKAFKKTMKETDWKATFKHYGEIMFYILVLNSVYWVLIQFGILKDFSTSWKMILVWVGTFLIGDWVIDKHEVWLFRRKIMKTAREVARYRGIDPKRLNYKDIKITVGDDGYMDIEIDIEDGTRRARKTKKKQ